MVISASNITKYYADDKVLDNVNLQINTSEKYGICGSNGVGKSTLLKILIGEITPDEGEVVKRGGLRIGYQAQYNNDRLQGNILDCVISARQDLIDMECELKRLESSMSAESVSEHDVLMDRFVSGGGLYYKSLAASALKGLGFDEDDLSKSTEMLSGGEMTRVNLARLLVSDNDLIILDEPINHLDMTAIMWLEDYLSGIDVPLIVVAHDRYFLDKVVTHVLDLGTRPARNYKGNYSEFVRQKDMILLTNEREVDKQNKEINRQREVIDTLKSYNREKSIKRAESRIKALDKLDTVAKIEDRTSDIQLSLNIARRSGDDVLTVDKLACVYDDNKIFDNVSFELKRGDRVALLGANGTGKSTILKMITGTKKPSGGRIRIGANVDIGYYDQAQMNLDDNNSVFGEIQDTYHNMDNTTVRNALAAVGFTGDDAGQIISTLSGGEKAKVSLCKLMLSDANLLILDEPTNHLDMESKDILEKALSTYDGTILFVSHDRYFINKVALKVLELTDNGVNEYLGNFDYYIEKKDKIKNRYEFSDKKESSNKSTKEDWIKQKEETARLQKLNRKIKNIEADIQKLEDEIAIIDAKLTDPANATNSYKLNELSSEREKINSKLEELFDKWETYALTVSK